MCSFGVWMRVTAIIAAMWCVCILMVLGMAYMIRHMGEDEE